MATVTGTINGTDGTKDVSLNNAATESTLKAILAAMTGSADKMQAAVNLAARAGLDSDSIEKANQAVRAETVSIKILTEEENKYVAKLKDRAQQELSAWQAVYGSLDQLIKGTATASGLLQTFGQQFSGTFGLVIQGFAKLVSIQEENFEAYQKLSASGVNFSGSLTQLRLAASNSYLTLDQFTRILKNNSEALAKMGGTADQGAIAFSRVGKELIQGDIGQKLMAMGYTTEEVNSGLANYIAMTGGRTAQEMSDTKKLSAAAGEYLSELDDLAQITGKSREQQEQALKEESANQAYQSYLLTLDEEGKKKANTALAEAMAKGGKGAAQALQSRLLGLPPITKAAQEFEAVAPKMAAANRKMADAVGDASKGVGDIKKAGNELGVAANQTKKDLGQTGNALIMQGGTFSQTIGTIFGTANRNAQQGVNNLEDAEKQRQSLEAKRQARQESEADLMSQGMAGLKDLGAELLQVFSPLMTVASYLVAGLGLLAKGISFVVQGFNKLFTFLGPAETIVKGLVVALGAYLILQRVANAQSTLKASGEDLLGKLKGRLPGGLGGGGGGGLAAEAPKGAGALAGVGGGGGGGGFVAFIRSLGRSLASLAPIAVPMLIGAGAVAGVIVILGAGVAAAIALVGLSLPVFAKGLTDFGKIDGTNLIKVAAGIGALGLAMVAFSAGSVVGGLGAGLSSVVNLFTGGGVIGQIQSTVAKLTPILPQLTALGPAINTYAQGIVAFGKAVNTVDIGKAEKLRAVLKPSATEALQNAGTQLIQAATKLAGGGNSAEEKTHSEMQALNNTMKDMLKYIKDTAENTKRTHDATKALNGNLFAV